MLADPKSGHLKAKTESVLDAPRNSGAMMAHGFAPHAMKPTPGFTTSKENANHKGDQMNRAKKVTVKVWIGQTIHKASIPIMKQCGDWAIHKPIFVQSERVITIIDIPGYRVTHIPSGSRFPYDFETKKLAMAVMLEMDKGPSWDGKGEPPKRFIDYGTKVYRRLNKNAT